MIIRIRSSIRKASRRIGPPLESRFRPFYVGSRKRFHAVAADWRLRVMANGGGAVSGQTLQAVSDFCRDLELFGLLATMKVLCTVVPDSLTAALTPLVKGTGLDPWTNYNFVSGDLTANGLAGNATNKQVNTGFVPSAGGFTMGNAGWTFYVAADNGGTQAELGGTSAGGGWSTDCIWGSSNCGGSAINDCFSSGSGRLSVANTGAGYYSANRVGINDFRLFKAHSSLAHGQVGGIATGGGNPPNLAMAAWGGWYQSVGAINYPTGKRLSFVAFHDGLTQAQSAVLYAAVQKMRVAMGGGYV